jgi:hypothetical protein
MYKVRFFGVALAMLFIPSVSSLAADSPLSPIGNVLQALTDNPAGWTRNMDGSYRQAETGVLCPKQFKSFSLQGLVAPSDAQPTVLGVCRYTDGEGRTGTIRVRRYPDDGMDATTVANDKALMAPDAPPMLMRASVDRPSAGTRLTVTIARKGFMVDCSVVQVERDRPKGDFPLYCTTIPTGN